MSKGSQILLLLIVLLLPTLIFLFLYSFGENKFEVDIQHPEGLSIKDCPKSHTAPFKAWQIDSLNIREGEFQLVYIEKNKISKEDLNQLRRITQNIFHIPFIFLYHSNAKDEIKEYVQENWSIYKLKKSDLEELNRCGFGNINNNSLILIDTDQHVRGYYALDNKELDRLEGEIKILLE